MSGLIPTVGLNKMLSDFVAAKVLTLKLFSNNHTPVLGDTAANYTVVTGGGYADINLDAGEWTIANGIATYNTYQDFNFTGATGAPGTIYGYYIVDEDGVVVGAELFPAGNITPIDGSLVSVRPKLTLANAA